MDPLELGLLDAPNVNLAPHLVGIMDAAQLAVVNNLLITSFYNMEATVYQRRYPNYDYAALVPVVTEGNEWALGTMFTSADFAGRAEWLNTKGFDMPYADVIRDAGMHTFHLGGIGYEWSFGEIQQAAMAGRDLPAEKAFAARRVSEVFLWNTCMTGASEKGMEGLTNSTLVTASMAPADGTGAATTFASKTGEQIARDINNLLLGIVTGTNEAEMADTLLLPFSVISYMTTTRMAAGQPETIMEWVRRNNVYTQETGQPLLIRSLRSLIGRGAGGTNRMVAYRRDPEVVRFHLPMPHRFLPPFQKSSMTWEVAGIFRTGGVEVRLPLAIRYLDGV